MFSESKSPSDLLEEIHVIEEEGFEQLLGLMAPLQQLAGEVVSSTMIQNQINSDAIKILENSKRMHNFMLSKGNNVNTTLQVSFLVLNRGEAPKVNQIEEMPVLYDSNNKAIAPNSQRNYLQEFEDVKTKLNAPPKPNSLGNTQQSIQKVDPQRRKTVVHLDGARPRQSVMHHHPDPDDVVPQDEPAMDPNDPRARNLVQISKQYVGGADYYTVQTHVRLHLICFFILGTRSKPWPPKNSTTSSRNGHHLAKKKTVK